MNQEIKVAKRKIRAFLKTIPTERLVEMLAWAQDGHMIFSDLCGCLLGTASTLQGMKLHTVDYEYCKISHYLSLRDKKLAGAAERGYLCLETKPVRNCGHYEEVRGRRRIIPIMKAELRLRERNGRISYEQETVRAIHH